VALIIATIPCVVIGFVLKRLGFEPHGLKLMAINSIIFGGLLWISDHFTPRRHREINFYQAMCIGLGQILAFLPGVSRLGSCLTVARFLGIERVPATHFAFLLSIPTVLGAVVLTVFDLIKNQTHLDWEICLQGGVITFIFGLATIRALLELLKHHGFGIFGAYRIALGALILIFL
jgi:undecaprenyl-diphosphatase